MDLRDNEIRITNPETGKETVMKILFTHHNDENDKDYIFFYDDNDKENIFVMYYENEDLYELEDDEEYDYADEVLESYLESLEKDN